MKLFVKILIIFWAAFITIILAMGATRYVSVGGHRITGTSKKVILLLAEIPANIYYLFNNKLEPLQIISTSSLKTGFTYTDKHAENKDYLLVSVWDDALSQSIVKLVRIRDGRILHKWVPDLGKLNNILEKLGVKTRLAKSTTQLWHPFVMDDGSLIFGADRIFKIDKNSNIIWSSTSPCHHSIEPDSEGNIWFCSYNTSTKNSKKYQILDDAVVKISAESGKVLFQKSVFEILMENGYGRGHFFINPFISCNDSCLDYMHLNDIQPVFEDAKYWKRGDLFLSLRHQNLVLLYRPSTNKIIWSQNGPWLRQHDVDIIDSVKIGIFGNNVIDAFFPDQKNRLLEGHNNQYIYDFSKNEISTPYTDFFKSSSIGTYTNGRSRILSNGDIFVEETNHGRNLYGNRNSELIWTYIERINNKKISQFTWSRYMTEEEFNKVTFFNEK